MFGRRRLTKAQLLAWQNAVSDKPSDRLTKTEQSLRRFTDFELPNAIHQIQESIEIIHTSKYPDTVMSRVAYLKKRVQFVESVRPFVEIPSSYPESEVKKILQEYR